MLVSLPGVVVNLPSIWVWSMEVKCTVGRPSPRSYPCFKGSRGPSTLNSSLQWALKEQSGSSRNLHKGQQVHMKFQGNLLACSCLTGTLVCNNVTPTSIWSNSVPNSLGTQPATAVCCSGLGGKPSCAKEEDKRRQSEHHLMFYLLRGSGKWWDI